MRQHGNRNRQSEFHMESIVGDQGATGADRGGGIILSAVSEMEPQEPAAPRKEDEPMLYCPVCSTRLTELKCKLVCATLRLLYELRGLLLKPDTHVRRVRDHIY